jgi:hypothetical protein
VLNRFEFIARSLQLILRFGYLQFANGEFGRGIGLQFLLNLRDGARITLPNSAARPTNPVLGFIG